MKSILSTAQLWQINIQLNSLDKIETDKVIHNVGFDIESSENKFHVASNQSLGDPIIQRRVYHWKKKETCHCDDQLPDKKHTNTKMHTM